MRQDVDDPTASHREAAHRPRAAARPATLRSRSAWTSPLVWTAAGFACGIAFWHVVGFWSFVGKVVFKGGHETAIATEQPSKPDLTVDGGSRARMATPAAKCVELRLDRSTSQVLTESCRHAPPPMIKAGPVAGRGDVALPRLQMHVPAVAGWSTQVRNQPETVTSPD